MNVFVDQETCVGCGTGVDICLELFEMQDAIAVTTKEDVPKDLEDDCRDAAEACAVEAIGIKEGGSNL